MSGIAPALRRGACPGLSAPMQTGDGLLVRLSVSGVDIGLDQARELCTSARQHGNGIVEITARGSIQVRGLGPASAAAFADAVAALEIDAGAGVPILVDPLAGLAPPPAVDGGAIAARLRYAIAASPFAALLGAKVSVVIDGGASLHLDAIAADVRLRAEAARWHVAVGGDAADAQWLGWVEAADVVEAGLRLLRVIAQRGPLARARDLLGEDGTGRFRAAMADLVHDEGAACSSPPPHQRVHAWLTPRHGEKEPPVARSPAEPIGLHLLHDGSLSLGVGLAFGHTDATALAQLIEAARTAGARALRTAPARALLFVRVSNDEADALTATTERLGFITRRDDPRRHVAACAGAPICASAEMPARVLAPQVAAAVATLLDGSLTLHLSGCRKGCAHPTGSALTIVGSERGCELVIGGTSRGTTRSVVATDKLLDAVARIADAVTSSDDSAAAALARLGPAEVARLFGGAHGTGHGVAQESIQESIQGGARG